MGLKRNVTESESGARKVLSDAEWYEVFTIIYHVVEAGGAASVYRGRDGAAIAVSVKSGKDSAVYWTGPGEDAGDKTRRAILEWGLPTDCPPVDGMIETALWDDAGKE